MYIGDAIKAIYAENGHFFDLILEDEMSKVINYSYLDHELLISEDGELKLGSIKKKQEIKTINELHMKMKELVLFAKDVTHRSIWDKIADSTKEQERKQVLDDYFSIKDEDMQLLVNQLIFDVLFYNYMQEDFKNEMKLPEYCDKYFFYNFGEKWVRATAAPCDFPSNKETEKDTAFHTIDRQAKRFIRIIEKKDLEDACAKIGFDTSDIKRFATSRKRPKIIWDHFFFASNKDLVTSRQYRRNFTLERKEDYLKRVSELNNYDKFVEKIMLERDGGNTPEEYFRKSMDFYILETEYRIDFMYELAGILENQVVTKGNRIPFLLNGSHISTVYPYLQQDENGDTILCFGQRLNTYLPITLIKKSCGRKLSDLLQESDYNPLWDDYLIEIYRAKAYELFKYHYVYCFGNYEETSNFIREHYDILSYHQKSKMWKEIKKEKLTPAQKTRLKNIQVINNSLFSEFEDWSRSGWKASNNGRSTTLTKSKLSTKIDEAKLMKLKSDEYGALLGMDKKTFEKILHILNDTFIKLHTPGGRPSRLSVLDKLVITIEYSRNRCTLESIAANYDVSKSRISDAVKWVKKTLADSEIPLDQILMSEHDK